MRASGVGWLIVATDQRAHDGFTPVFYDSSFWKDRLLKGAASKSLRNAQTTRRGSHWIRTPKRKLRVRAERKLDESETINKPWPSGLDQVAQPLFEQDVASNCCREQYRLLIGNRTRVIPTSNDRLWTNLTTSIDIDRYCNAHPLADMCIDMMPT